MVKPLFGKWWSFYWWLINCPMSKISLANGWLMTFFLPACWVLLNISNLKYISIAVESSYFYPTSRGLCFILIFSSIRIQGENFIWSLHMKCLLKFRLHHRQKLERKKPLCVTECIVCLVVIQLSNITNSSIHYVLLVQIILPWVLLKTFAIE